MSPAAMEQAPNKTRQIRRWRTRRSAGRRRRLIAASSTVPARLSSMAKEKIRLGGMALANGVLVHGPTAWACAIRTRDGRVEVASAQKTLRSSEIESPLLRVPARLAEAIAVLPAVGRALPEAELPFK